VIIGLVGTPGAGNETAAGFLRGLNPNFVQLTFSDAINAELGKQSTEINRENQQRIANEYGDGYGSEVWAEKCLKWRKVRSLS